MSALPLSDKAIVLDAGLLIAIEASERLLAE
jgi:hypothetical protein